MVSEDVKKRLPCSGALRRKNDRKVNNVGDMNRGEEAGLCSTGERERKRQDDLVFAEETAFSPGQEGRRPCVNNGKAQGERSSDSGNEAMRRRGADAAGKGSARGHREGSA